MIKKYQNSAGVMTRFADVIFVGLTWLIAYPIRFDALKFFPFGERPNVEHYLGLLPLILVLWASCFQLFGVYHYDQVLKRSREIYTLLRAHLATLMVFTSLTYFVTQFRFSRGVILVFGVLVFFLLWIFRVISRKILRELNKQGKNTISLVAVGEGKMLDSLLQQVHRYPELGLNLVKLIGPSEYDQSLVLIRSLQPKIVLIGLPRSESDRTFSLIKALKDETFDLQIIPDYSEYFALGATVESFAGIPLIQLNESPLFGYQAWLKRAFDILLAGMGLLVVSPLLLITAICVKFTSEGSIFYKQERMGLDGETFTMYKFRSMRADAEANTGAVWASENDMRRTRFGKFLRSTSIDELPQLWNVFAGHMSLVGPRPERPVFVSKFRNEIPNYMLRHKVKTGITGWAQVNGWRGDTSIEKRIECDLYYIRNWSIWLDFKILILTVVRGFIHKNAY
jgi:Undecaprenyl-phosphate glucose phosphotransferase